MKIFKFIYGFLSNKYVRILLFLLVIFSLFYFNFNSKLIDKEEVVLFIDSVKNKKVKKFINDTSKKNEVVRNNNFSVVKKNIIPIIEDEEKKEEIIENVTNVFFVMRRLSEIYQERLKNNQINYKRVAKYGDYIYYSVTVDFGEYNKYLGENDNKIYFFTVVSKDQESTKIFLNKKVGDKINLGFDNYFFVNDINFRDNLNKALDQEIERLYGSSYNGKEFRELISNPNQIITILDFIPKKYVEELKLNIN